MPSIQESVAIHLSKVLKEWHCWDKNACSCSNPGKLSGLSHFTAHVTQICQLLFLMEDVKRKQTRTAYCPCYPRAEKTQEEVLPSCCSLWHISLYLYQGWICSQDITLEQFTKWSSNHGLLGTACWNPAAQALQQEPVFCMLQVWGCQHAPSPRDHVKKQCRSLPFSQQTSLLTIFTWAPKHICDYAKQHTSPSDSMI